MWFITLPGSKAIVYISVGLPQMRKYAIMHITINISGEKINDSVVKVHLYISSKYNSATIILK